MTNDQKSYDIAVIGGGILGTTLLYWLSALYPRGKFVLLEQAGSIAAHTSTRNTGVIHRPFYLDPQTKKRFAEIALHSYPLWKAYAELHRLPWRDVGTLEIALSGEDEYRLDTYLAWARKNGLEPDEVVELSPSDVRRTEPNIVCRGAIFSKKDAAVDFGLMTRSLARDAAHLGAAVHTDARVEHIDVFASGVELRLTNGEILSARYAVNCAGGNALPIAHRLGLARDYADMNFRGEYWVVDHRAADLAGVNIYTVPRHSSFPFLDPHWVVKADGTVEVGPTAVPVLGPYTYFGLAPNILAGFLKFVERPLVPKFKLWTNRDFLSLAASEWRGMLSKHAMAERVRAFLPDLKDSYLVRPGNSGVRASLIDARGAFVPEVVELEGDRMLHILNFNSPGATGAPAYAARLVRLIIKSGVLPEPKQEQGRSIWNWKELVGKLT